MKIKISHYLPGIVLFIIAVITGLAVYQDYGISWDEPIQRDLGLVTYNYVFKGDRSLMTYQDRALGTGFELPLILLEKCLKLTDSRDIYMARHLASHIFFLACAMCGYFLVLRLFKSKLIASLGYILLVCHPRIYAHSFFNSKDVPFLASFLIVMLVAAVAFEKKRWQWYLLLGMVCGYSCSIRSMGVLFAACFSLFFLIDICRDLYSKKRIDLLLLLPAVSFFAGFVCTLYAAWPYLWSAPVQNFISAFQSLVKIAPGGNVLFNGEYYPSANLPWEYMPVWFFITIPELWLIAGIAGMLYLIVSMCRKPVLYFLNTAERNFVLYLACFLGPIAAMIVFNGVNIDDWRHLYYIYPCFVMMVLFVINKLMQRRGKWLILVAAGLQLVITCCLMVTVHPFQQVYFNSLVSHKKDYLQDKFDLDYWGCSFKQGLEHLAATQKQDSIKIYWSIPPLPNNIMILPEKARRRIFIIDDRDRADYLITNFRGNRKVAYPDLKSEYTITVLNSRILCIYKLH